MRYGRQSTEGYAQGSRLPADRCASYELDGDVRQTRGFIQVWPPWVCNTYILHQIVLLCMKMCNEMCFEGVPCPPYIVRGVGLQIWKLILVGYNSHSWPDKDSYSNRPGSCLISKFAFLPYAGCRSDQLGRASSLSWAEPTELSQPKSSHRGIGVNTPTASPRELCIVMRHAILTFSEQWGLSSWRLWPVKMPCK
jgi:hypothetical protein